MHWKYKSFDELTKYELYFLLALRAEIFVVEQEIAYQDLDQKDFSSFHLLGTNTVGDLIAYARILPAGISYPEISIGRVVVSNKYRAKGLGRTLMNQCFQYIEQQYGNVPIRISAQVYLEKFYQSLGFKNQSDSYMEDGIPHVEMLRE
ncbi:MAG: GNAT family N-acetyltransferase [Bacteroidia bacterium]